jgi:hypothetical protein
MTAIRDLVEELTSTMLTYHQGGPSAIDPETIEYKVSAKAQAISDLSEKQIVNYLRLQGKQDNKLDS